jgi:hypothetical protein
VSNGSPFVSAQPPEDVEMKEILELFRTAISTLVPKIKFDNLDRRHVAYLGPMLLNVRAWEKVKDSGIVMDWTSFEMKC